MSRFSASYPRFVRFLGRFGLPAVYFLLLALVFSWPAARDFTTRYIGIDGEDPPHNLWLLWHVKEALLGHQSLFKVSLLYYPAGISLHLHGVGPLFGLLALPFWPIGPAAAYNGVVLLGLTLNGLAVYLLVRYLKRSNSASLFSGTLYFLAPMHLAGLYGHFEKVFTALLPLTLLAVLLSLDIRRSRWWSLSPAVLLLLSLLTNGLHFIVAFISALFLILVKTLRNRSGTRVEILRRLPIIGFTTILLVGPLLAAINRATRQPGIQVDLNYVSANYQPDLLQFFLPPPFFTWFGSAAQSYLVSLRIEPHIEKYLFLSWIGLILTAIALASKGRKLRKWLFLFLGWAVLALGPTLRVFGREFFSEYNLPVLLPYAFFTMLPGLDFLRTPGRLMFIGFTAFAILAGTGLTLLQARWPRQALPLAVGLTLLIILESWPRPWPTQPLAEVLPFYQGLANDPAEYGVLDLPVNPPEAEYYVTYAVRYQLDQMTHKKALPTGYIDRRYLTHPLFPCVIPNPLPPQPDLLVNGRSAPCYTNLLFELAANNYHYIVWHKPRPGDEYSENPAKTDTLSGYLMGQLAEAPPYYEDELTTVYTVPPLSESEELSPTIAFLHNWYGLEDDGHWMASPASLLISTPQPHIFNLILIPGGIFAPSPGPAIGRSGTILVQINGHDIGRFPVESGHPTTIPLNLEVGVHTVEISLEAGNFTLREISDSIDNRPRSLAIQSINLTFEEEE